MKIQFAFFLLFGTLSSAAQFYYRDIISVKDLNRQMYFLKLNKVLTVSATGYDPMGIKNSDFSETQEVIYNTNSIKFLTISNPLEKTTLLLKFDKEDRLIFMSDSSKDVLSNTVYKYNAEGRLEQIMNISSDSSQTIQIAEEHKWFYNAAGSPLKMLKIVDKSDTTEIRFTLDENNNVIDERPFKNNKEGEMVYYYYDEKNRLTDIVRYHKKLKKLIPDYLFEYDESDRVIQKITTLSNLNLGYLIWRYAFNSNGLKTKEALFNKEKEITGKIEYSYTFGQSP